MTRPPRSRTGRIRRFIDAGEPITVVRVDGNRIVVRRLPGKD